MNVNFYITPSPKFYNLYELQKLIDTENSFNEPLDVSIDVTDGNEYNQDLASSEEKSE